MNGLFFSSNLCTSLSISQSNYLLTFNFCEKFSCGITVTTHNLGDFASLAGFDFSVLLHSLIILDDVS